MRRTTIVVIFFVLIAAIVIGISQFLQSQPPVEFTAVINPLAESWLRDSINRFNDTQPVVGATQRIQFNIVVMDDLPIWQGSTNYTPENHPAVWIATSGTSVGYADRYTVRVPSLARTPLVWGGYASRVEIAAAATGGVFDWQAVQNAASAQRWDALPGGQSGWGFVNLAFTRPDMTMSGLGTLLMGAASYHNSGDLSGPAVRDPGFRGWMQPIIASVPNFQTLGSDPAAAVARGPATAAMALLPENLWLNNLRGLTDSETFMFSYPAYQFMLDFPLAGWNGPVTDLERQAVQALADWLMQPAQQARTVNNGLRPAAGEPDETAALFTAAESFGIQRQPDYGAPVQAPSRTEAAGLLQWFTNISR